ncbi:MAG: universal stress protein [Hyphomicrobiaceae bacterium]
MRLVERLLGGVSAWSGPQAPVRSEVDEPPARLPLSARNVLLASHGSEGARAAESRLLESLTPGAHLRHLLIVPEFWQHMSGDGWRINASTEHLFCDYLENQLEQEALDELHRVHALATARGITYSAASRFGPLETSLAEEAAAGEFDLVVIGAPRPRGAAGLRSRMDVAVLLGILQIPLLVVPHPRAKYRR